MSLQNNNEAKSADFFISDVEELKICKTINEYIFKGKIESFEFQNRLIEKEIAKGAKAITLAGLVKQNKVFIKELKIRLEVYKK